MNEISYVIQGTQRPGGLAQPVSPFRYTQTPGDCGPNSVSSSGVVEGGGGARSSSAAPSVFSRMVDYLDIG